MLHLGMSNKQKHETMSESELRSQAQNMSKEEMINLRDYLENNWDSSKRNLMMILSIACINKFKTTISNL